MLNKHKIKLEINVHHLRGNAILAGHVQNPLSDIFTKYCVVEDSYIRSLKQNFDIIGIEMWG